MISQVNSIRSVFRWSWECV